jgi:hypothetical protein
MFELPMFRVLLMLSVAASPVVASMQAGAAQRLARVNAVACTFPTVAKGDWNKQTGAPQGDVSHSDFSVGFEQINTDEGTAVAVGTFGPSDIIVRFAVGTLHLVQSFNEGPLYVTSIFSDETPNGQFKAVHTRHEFTVVSLPGFTSRPEQYYGTCAIKQSGGR